MFRRFLIFAFSVIALVAGIWSAKAIVGGGTGVNLAWSPSADTNVVGYALYYGPASGTYTQRVDVGNVTGITLTNLTPGSTNYFVATSYDAEATESVPSNEISYINPGTLQASLGSDNSLHLLFPVAAGHAYDIQYCEGLTNWVTLATIIGRTNSIYDFVDTTFTGTAQRFYRLILH